MSPKILQLNFALTVTEAEYQQIVAPLASQFAAVPGLRWKIWMVDEARHEAGGIYLFEDEASLTAFLEGPLAAACMAHPALSDFSAKTFDVLEDLTAITRGPVEAPVRV
jgi:hypothetical protein